ncbi:MAG: LysM peptidoglycan-binding domain-containing protein [Bacteroidia bacterium]
MKRFSPFRSILIVGTGALLLLSTSLAQSVGKITFKQDKPVAVDATGTPPKTHKVNKGETLLQIAKKYNRTVDELAAINDLEDEDKIYPGQVLTVSMEAKSVTPIQGIANRTAAPAAGQRTITKEKPVYYAMKKGDDIFSVSDTREVTVDQLKAWNPTATFTQGERVIVGKEYTQVIVGAPAPSANQRMAGNMSNLAENTNTAPPAANKTSLLKPVEAAPMAPKAVTRGDAPAQVPVTVDPAGRNYTLPNLTPAGSIAINQRYGEVDDPRLSMRFYVHHKTLPIGSKINVLIPGSNGYVQAEVVGRLAQSSSADIGLSPDLMRVVNPASKDGTVTISYN